MTRIWAACIRRLSVCHPSARIQAPWVRSCAVAAAPLFPMMGAFAGTSGRPWVGPGLPREPPARLVRRAGSPADENGRLAAAGVPTGREDFARAADRHHVSRRVGAAEKGRLLRLRGGAEHLNVAD